MNEIEKSGVREECGVFAIYDQGDGLDVARLTYYALFALQHRGQQSTGIAVNNQGTLSYHKNLGLVPEVYNDDILDKLTGQIAIGHVRYATSEENTRENAQPLVTKYVKGTLTIAYNGSILNSNQLKSELEENGAVFQGTNDAELMAYLIAKERLSSKTVEQAAMKMAKKLIGAYSIVLMSPSKLIAMRDPKGMKPLCMGKLNNSYIFASESVALDSIGAEFVRDVLPGEVIIVTKDGLKSITPDSKEKGGLCIFEHVYFARPDSVIDGSSVYEARKQAGKFLAMEHPVDADVVIAVPDSGIGAAIGYAEQSKITYDVGLMKNRYIARTFIQPTQSMRENAVRIKLNALSKVVSGKRVVMVDDSIVRGTTSKRIVQILREAGAIEVHMRISSPPFLYPCYFGTDIGTQDVLVAVDRSVEEIAEIIGVDSLGYLSLENMMNVAPDSQVEFCNACFTGEYPIDISPIKEKCTNCRAFIKNLD